MVVFPLPSVKTATTSELIEPDNDLEEQRGFAWIGQHEITGTDCLGSEWSIAQVEEFANVNEFNLITDGRREYVPSQGDRAGGDVVAAPEHQPVCRPGSGDFRLCSPCWAPIPRSRSGRPSRCRRSSRALIFDQLIVMVSDDDQVTATILTT